MISFGEPQKVKVKLPDGTFREWTVGRVEIRVIRAFRDWIAERLGDPFAAAERWVDKLPPEQAVLMVREAEQTRDQLASFSLGCPLARRFLATEEGQAVLFQLLLEPAHPDVTEEEAWRVAQALGEKAAEVLAKASGEAGAAPKNAQHPAA